MIRIKRSRKFASLVFLLSLFAGSSYAEIYKWQDANGRWHFSDSPRDNEGKQVQSVNVPSKRNKKLGDNLQEALTEKFRPASIVEEVTIAVVGVETTLGQGSGFFVSTEGHIVTNKHVIRPGDYSEERDKQLDDQEKRLDKVRKALEEEKAYLDRYGKQLEEYRGEVYSRSSSEKSVAVEEYSSYESRYAKRLDEYRTQKAKYDKRLREFERKKNDYRLKSSMAGAARSFVIYLKDNTKLKANLVRISKEYDLALLKLDGYTTPSLVLGDENTMLQGNPVFAVGSPLGMRDSVTSGIITRRLEDYLVTDAQILPGNSGGPLLNDAGEVVGVNTLKRARQVMAEGFGMAIPISIIESEFDQYLP